MKRAIPCIVLLLSALLLFSACQKQQQDAPEVEVVPEAVPEASTPSDTGTPVPSDEEEEVAEIPSPYVFDTLTAVDLDGAELTVPEDFRCRVPEYSSSYYRFETLLDLLDVDGISTFSESSTFHDVTVPAHSVATYCRGYVTVLTLDDTFAITTAPGKAEPAYTDIVSGMTEVDGSYYLYAVDIPALFLVGANEDRDESSDQVKALHLTTLDAAIDEAKAFAASQGYVYEPTGDPFYDRYILSDLLVAHTKAGDAASVFWPSEGRMLMGPIMDDVTVMPYGFRRTMCDASGNPLYGYYASPFGNETLEVCYSELECVDARNGLYSIAIGFGEAKRYGAVLIPNGMVNEMHMLEPYSQVPLTAEEILDYFLSQGYFTEGQWEQQVYLTALETDDLETFSANSKGDTATIQLLIPVSWNSDGSGTNYWEGIGFNERYHQTALRLSLGAVVSVSQTLMDAHPEDFWMNLYPEETAQSTEITKLEDRTIYRVTLPGGTAENGETYIPYHYYIYFQGTGVLCDITLYGEKDSPYAVAQFERMAETLEVTNF